MTKNKKTDQQWQEELTDEQYRITRKKGTEMSHSGEYDQFFEEGVYHCVCCGEKLFESDEKYDAGCGWPSFKKPAKEAIIDEHLDEAIPGMPRTEVVCHQCDAHLGHVFSDGPSPGGLRYCINSVALKFNKEKK